MFTEFLSAEKFSPELEEELSELSPANPFCTSSYAEAMCAQGHQPWLLGVKAGERLVSGCRGFISAGRLNRVLQISSLPAPIDDVFWDGLLRFCSRHAVSCVELHSFASNDLRIPRLRHEVERHNRCEYVMDLCAPDWEQKIARKHWQNIQRARQAGLSLRRAEGVEACREHVRLMCATMDRRRRRGESVPDIASSDASWYELLLAKGAAQLFQAVGGDAVFSSAMVLRAPKGAYNESAGTSAKGLTCGASHFLLHAIATSLRDEAVDIFNLGGAEENPGLALFKSRFGTRKVSSESATFYLGSKLRRRLTRVGAAVRRAGATL